MKTKFELITAIFASFLLLFVINSPAQENFLTTGGEICNQNGSLSYSLGQVFYVTNSSSSGAESQGVQQPYEIYTITGVKDIKEISLHFIAYPNPTEDFIELRIEGELRNEYHYFLIDAKGRELKNGNITKTITRIQMSELVSAIYFLNVESDNGNKTTFKIIKR